MSEPRFVHQSRVSQAGFTIIPNVVMTRSDLSPTAKLIYGYLKHLAWRDRVDTVDPPIDTIGDDLCIGRRAVMEALAALRAAPVAEGGPGGGEGALVESIRRGQGRTNVYLIREPEDPADTLEDAQPMTPERQTRSADTAPLEVPEAQVPARARSSPRVKRRAKSKPSGAIAPVVDGPPKSCRIDGQNLPLNALIEVCQIGGEGGVTPRAQMALVYLNGPKNQPELGIRSIFWAEISAWAHERGPAEVERLHSLTSEEFERALAMRIQLKARVFHDKMPGVTMGPRALRNWWFDVERTRVSGGGRLTADEFAEEFRAAMRVA